MTDEVQCPEVHQFECTLIAIEIQRLHKKINNSALAQTVE